MVMAAAVDHSLFPRAMPSSSKLPVAFKSNRWEANNMHQELMKLGEHLG